MKTRARSRKSPLRHRNQRPNRKNRHQHQNRRSLSHRSQSHRSQSHRSQSRSRNRKSRFHSRSRRSLSRKSQSHSPSHRSRFHTQVARARSRPRLCSTRSLLRSTRGQSATRSSLKPSTSTVESSSMGCAVVSGSRSTTTPPSATPPRCRSAARPLSAKQQLASGSRPKHRNPWGFPASLSQPTAK